MKKKIKAVLIGVLIWIAVIALIICVCVFKPVAAIVAAAALVFLLIITIMAIYDYVR